MRSSCLLFLLLFAGEVLAQQPPGVEWERCLPNTSMQAGLRINDSSFMVFFETLSCGDSTGAGWQVYDFDGNLLWENSIPAQEFNYHIFSATGSDNAFLVTGSKTRTDSNFHWLARLEASGNLLWEKDFYFSDTVAPAFSKAIFTSDGGILLAGETFDDSLRNVWLMKLDANGNALWQSEFKGSRNESARDVVETIGGGFLIAANTNSGDGDVTGYHDLTDAWLIQTDNNGHMVWNRCYGDSADDQVVSLTPTETGFFFAGMSRSADGDANSHYGSQHYFDYWMVRLDANGTLLGNWNAGGSEHDWVTQMASTENGSKVITGNSYSTDFDAAGHHGSRFTSDQFTLLMDTNGTVLWKKSTGGSSDDWSSTVIALDSGMYIVAGGSISTDGDHQEPCFSSTCGVRNGGWLVKLNEQCPSFPTPAFSYTQEEKEFLFTNESYNATDYAWDFGDGGTSTDTSPMHTYTLAGKYAVCLVANDTCSSKTFCTEVSTCAVPLCKFSFSNNSGAEIAFENLSSPAQSWFWDFGDGLTSSLQDPVHTYAQNGSFEVTLTLTDSCGQTASIIKQVSTCPGYSAAFTYEANGNNVFFEDESDAYPGYWLWDFGDGFQSEEINPVHTYLAGGNYTVCLISASGSCLQDTVCQELTVCDPLVSAPFLFETNELEATFQDASGNATEWFWDFGDGSTSVEENPVHAFSASGSYWVCEMVTNGCTADTFCAWVEVSCLLPVAAFYESVNGLEITMTNTSSDATGFAWDFGDGTVSTETNPVHVYAVAGIYEVCLITFNLCGSDTLCLQVTTACPPFTATYNFVQDNDTVAFFDGSVGAVEWWWNFGDSSTSTEQNPVHVYNANGSYEVCLIVFDGCTEDTLCDTLHVIGLAAGQVSNTLSLAVYPNPSDGYSVLEVVSNSPFLLTIQLLDVTGRILDTLNPQLLWPGRQQVALPTSGLPPGSYFIRVSGPAQVAHLPLVIQ